MRRADNAKYKCLLKVGAASKYTVGSVFLK